MGNGTTGSLHEYACAKSQIVDSFNQIKNHCKHSPLRTPASFVYKYETRHAIKSFGSLAQGFFLKATSRVDVEGA